MEVIVQDQNNIIIDVDQGRAGRGISTVNLITIGADYYLQFVYTDGVTEQVGPIATTVTELIYAEVRNAEAVTILKGQPVYLYQAQGNLATVKLAYNTSDATSAKTLGLAAENITAGSQGLVLTQGTLSGIDTSAYAEGDTLYLGATPGTLTSVKPKAPNHLVYIGVVERANAGAGQIYVRVQNGFELDEIHDVQINNPVNGQTIIYDATTDLWKNANLTAGAGITIVNGPSSVTISAPQVGTVTSVDASGGTTGLTFSGGPITSSGTLTMAGTLAVANGGTGVTTSTGSGSNVLSTSPTLVTPALGAATATSINGLTVSSTTGTLTLANGSTLATSGANSLTLTTAGATNVTFPTSGTLATTAGTVATFSAGTTGFTPSTASSGAVTLAGTLATTNGGTGLTSFTANGVVYASSTSALTTGSALTFDGSRLALTTATSNIQLTTSVNTNQAYISLADADGRTAVFRSPNSGSPNVAQIGTTTNHDVAFLYGNAEQMRLTSTGLGIGTSSPGAKLQVNSGDIRIVQTGTGSNNGIYFRNAANSATYAKVAYVQDTGELQVGTTDAYSLLLQTNGTTKATLDASGNLGLGVTPSAWRSNTPAFQIGASGVSLFSDSGITAELGNNVFLNASSQYIYQRTDLASRYQQYQGAHRFYTAPSGTAGNAISFTQAMTLDANGRWLLGTTTGVGNDFTSIRFNSGGTYPQGMNMVDSNASASGAVFQVFRKSDDTYLGNIRRNSTDNAIYVGGNSYLALGSGDTERARITSGGELLVGKTAEDTTSPGTTVAKFSANVGAIRNVKTATGTYESLQNYHNGTYVGGITYSDTATALATSSDARLKKNIVAAESAKNLIDGISVKAFDWKVNDEHQRYGFIAQELLTVFPEAVIKGSDEQETLAVDNARFIPVLVKAIQEQQAIIEQLKARLDAANL